MDNAFGTVDPVDAEDQSALAEAASNLTRQRRMFRNAREPAKGGGFDADRKDAEAHAPLVHFERTVAHWLRALRNEVSLEIFAVVPRLEADEIIVRQTAENLVVARHGVQDVRRRAGLSARRSSC